MSDVESTRAEYKPDRLRVVFIAEAPPADENRFFYFQDVRRYDGLFLEMMKVLYPEEDYSNIEAIRARKCDFLQRFQDEGFFLIDACDTPIERCDRAKKKRRVRECLPGLVDRTGNLVTDGVPVILISASIYDVCLEPLRSRGFNVVNTEMIPFPSSGWQTKFRERLGKLLSSLQGKERSQ